MTDGGSTRRLAITGTLSAALTGLAVVGVWAVLLFLFAVKRFRWV